MIVIRDPADTATYLAEGRMRCPNCTGTLGRWGYGRERTLRALGTGLVRVRPQRLRCHDCRGTHIVLPAALQPRRADTTAVIGTALLHRANGLGHRRIATLMGRAESTVRRWLRRRSDSHLDWMWRQGSQRLIQLAPDVYTELRYTGNVLRRTGDMLRHTLTVLAAAAYWDRARCGFTDEPWTLIGMYTRGRLLTPP